MLLFPYKNPLIAILAGCVLINNYSFLHENNERDNSLEKGIYLENKNVLIPWGTKFAEITKYGQPVLACSNKSKTVVRWDSSKIFNSIPVNLYTSFRKCFQRKEPKGSFHTIHGTIDSLSIPKVKHYLDSVLGNGDSSLNRRGDYYYYWRTNKCNFLVGYHRKIKSYFGMQLRVPIR